MTSQDYSQSKQGSQVEPITQNQLELLGNKAERLSKYEASGLLSLLLNPPRGYSAMQRGKFMATVTSFVERCGATGRRPIDEMELARNRLTAEAPPPAPTSTGDGCAQPDAGFFDSDSGGDNAREASHGDVG